MLEMNGGVAHSWHHGLREWDADAVRTRSSGVAGLPPRRRPVSRVLVVTACAEAREALQAGLEAMQREVLHAEEPKGLGRMVGPANIDLVICDQRLVADDEVEVLRSIRGPKSTLPVAWFDTPPHRTDGLVALPHGPIGRLRLPVEESDLQRLMQAAELPLLPERVAEPCPMFHGMVSGAANMQEVFRRIRRVGPTDASVLITGESGTGKELVAQALHRESPRRDRPFIALNCSALPSELVESELFGHTRGAFTGAMRDRAGLFEAADGGTLFLDEIGDLGLLAQAKVLRALESREVMRVGGTKTTAVDVRVIAATHRDLSAMVATGAFREDLLYRIQVIGITLPPLRERTSDVPRLTEHFAHHFAERHGLPVRLPDRLAQEQMIGHLWPGNIRELRNSIEGALILCDGDTITINDLPLNIARGSAPAAATPSADDVAPSPVEPPTPAELPFLDARERALEAFDRHYLTNALARHDGNIARTARAIGLHRQSLQKLLTRRRLRTGPGET